MKIAFFCTSLEPGCDGVGDYTKQLAYELINQGNSISIISFQDEYVIGRTKIVEKFKERDLLILRLPSCLSIDSRIEHAKEFVNNFNPDYLSFQFVIYGFHSKGLPFGLGKHLSIIAEGKRCHIMFHEIWSGITKLSPVKHKIYGYFQRNIIQDFLKRIKPEFITTSNKLYQLILDSYNIQSKVLPLFSNIPVALKNNDIIDKLYKELGYKINSEYIIMGIFGTLYPEANLEAAIESQLIKARNDNKELIFTSFGRIGTNGNKEYDRLKKLFNFRVQFAMLGELSQEQISTLLQIMQVGISCTPVQHLGKSGVFAAMRLHNLPVVALANDSIPEYDLQIKKYNEYLFQRQPYKWDVKYVAKKFVNLIY